MAESLELPRPRSDSSSSNNSQSTTGRLMLRQRLSQLLTCVEDLSSDDETNEEVSRTLDEAFSLCGRWTNKDFFRWPSEGLGGLGGGFTMSQMVYQCFLIQFRLFFFRHCALLSFVCSYFPVLLSLFYVVIQEYFSCPLCLYPHFASSHINPSSLMFP